MSDSVERPITVNTQEKAKDTYADISCPEGSYNGAHALADDEVREQLGKKSEYPLRVVNDQAPDLSEMAKEERARDFAGEKGLRGMDVHPGSHPNWKNTDIPYSSLSPEVVDEKEKIRSRK